MKRLSQGDFEAVIIQFRNGNGSVHQLKFDSAEFSSSDNEDRISSVQDISPVAPSPLEISENNEHNNENYLPLKEIFTEKFEDEPLVDASIDEPNLYLGKVFCKNKHRPNF